MVAAGLIVGYLFDGLGLTPSGRHAKVDNASTAFGWNITTALDVVALAVAAALVWRFFASGARADAADDERADGRGTRSRPSPP